MLDNRIKNKVLNWVIVALAVVLEIAIAVVSIQVVNYSSLLKELFIGIYIILILLVLIIAVLVVLAIRKSKLSIKITTIIISILLTIVFLFGNVTLGRVNKNVNNIVNNNTTIKESLSVAFVTYNNGLIVKEEDIEGHKFGIVGNENFQEGNVLAKEELSAKKINVDFVEYDSYFDLLMGLFSDECEVAALPANYVEIYGDTDGFEDYLDLTSIVYKFDKVVEVTNSAGNSIDVTSTPFTVLVIGVDEGRSDSLILMSVNPITMTLTMTSIARDTYVPISCYKNNQKDKINHARSVNRQCTVETVENWLDIPVDFYVETNFQGVIDIVDTIGGLKITSPISFAAQDSSTERGHYTIFVPEGTNYLNGEQVLAFARERYLMPNGDYDRQVNQQQVIKSLINKVFEIKDINVLLNVLDVAGNNISTNMSINQMTSLANYAFKVMESTSAKANQIVNIKNSRISGYGSYYYNYSSKLPLWIMIPYKGAISDAKKLINDNLTLPQDKVLTKLDPLQATILWYEAPKYTQDEYDEVLEIVEMPDFMPVMKHKYTLDQARAWCRERNIKLTIVKVEEGDSLYVQGAAKGTIVSQSVAYATLTSDFSELTLWVIGGVSVPDFEGSAYKEAISWCAENGNSYEVVWILENDSDYDESQAGLIKKQTYDESDESFEFTVYDYPSVSESFPSKGSSISQVEKWAEKTGVTVEYIGSGDKVVSYSVKNFTGDITSKAIKTNSLITVNTDTIKYTVQFNDAYGNELSKQIVESGLDAVAPSVIAPDGKEFDRWDTNYTNVTSDLVINPVFKDKAIEENPPETSPEDPEDVSEIINEE